MKNKIKNGWHYWRMHAWIRRWTFVGVWFLGFTVLMGGALFGPRVSSAENTPLNQSQQFNGNNNSSDSAMTLVSKAYSPKQKRMLIQLKTDDQNDATQQILAKYMQFDVETLANSDATVNVVPVTDDDYIIDISNLNPGFQAMKLKVTNDTPVTGSTSGSQGSVVFYMNEDKSLNKTKVPNLSDTQLAGKVVSEQIVDVQNDTKKQHQNIQKAQQTISADNDRKNSLQSNMQYQVSSQRSQTKQNIDDLNSDISQNEQNIDAANKTIQVNNNKIQLLQKKEVAIKNGTFKLPPARHSVKISSKN